MHALGDPAIATGIEPGAAMAPLNFARLQSFIEQAETEDGIDRLEDSEAQLWGQQLAEVGERLNMTIDSVPDGLLCCSSK